MLQVHLSLKILTGNLESPTEGCLREAEPPWPDQDLLSVACIFITLDSLRCSLFFSASD